MRSFLIALLVFLIPLAAAEHPLGTPMAGGDQLWERGDTVWFMQDNGEMPGAYHFVWRLRDGLVAVRPELDLVVQPAGAHDLRGLAGYAKDSVAARQPTVVVICTGQWAASQPATAAANASQVETNLKQTIEMLKDAHAELVMLAPTLISDTPEAKTPENERLAQYAEVIAGVAKSADVTYVDAKPKLLEYLKANPPAADKPSLCGGELRYTAAYHKIVAETLAPAIGERMAKTPMRIDIQDQPFIDTATIEIPIKRVRKGIKVDIRYSLDGKEPSKTGKKYEKPFKISGANTTLMVLATDEGTGNTARARALFTKVKAKASDSMGKRALGLEWGLFQGHWSNIPDFAAMKPVITGVWNGPEITAYRDNEAYGALRDNLGLRFIGYLDVPVEGVYKISTISDDGSRLWIGDELVADNDGGHGMRERAGRIALREGTHKVRVDWFNGGGGLGLEVWWESEAGIRRSRIPDSAWSYNASKPHDWKPVTPPPPKEEPKKEDPKKDPKKDGKKEEPPKK